MDQDTKLTHHRDQVMAAHRARNGEHVQQALVAMHDDGFCPEANELFQDLMVELIAEAIEAGNIRIVGVISLDDLG